jgi:hypothetical protein
MVSDILVTSAGTLSPGVGVGTASLRATGSVTLAASAIYRVELGSTSSYDLLAVDGALFLGSSSLRIIPGPGVKVGDSFMIISKSSASPVAGTFSGLPEGTQFVVSNRLFQITYIGGNGNDVVVTRRAPPAVALSIARAQSTQVRIGGQGVPGLIYVLEGTSSLIPPTVWRPLGTNVAVFDGAFGFLDVLSPPPSRRIYRVWSP